MKNRTSKQKFKYLKLCGVILDFIMLIGVNLIFVLLEVDLLWEDIPTNGITSFPQWITLILYRFLLYLAPAILLTFFVFDKRYKIMTRFIIWLNWTLFIYLILNVIIKVFAIDMIINMTIFNSLDSVVLLMGYILTFFSKKKVEFDSTGAIIGELK